MHCVKSLFSSQYRLSRRILTSTQLTNIKTKNNLIYQKVYLSQVSADEIDETEQYVNEICKGDVEAERKLRLLMLEVEVMRQDGRSAPDYVKKDQWEHLLASQSKNQRISYLKYLWKTEKSRLNQKAKKEYKRKLWEETEPEEVKEFADDRIYGLQNQSLFVRIRDGSINNYDNYRALQAIQHGCKVVIDCSYEEHMVYRERVNAAKQMTFVVGDNRIHKDPFDLHLCNLDLNGSFMKQLRKNIPTLEEPWFPINIHTGSYMDLFPKEKLVYLTPHCREELTTFDEDAIYIIGCMVDKVNNEPLSLAKAKRDRIKMAKLPLDRYLEWGPGAKKNLNINHMVPILLDLHLHGDWDHALRHIPRRKLMATQISAMQNNPMNRRPQVKIIPRHENFRKSHTLHFNMKSNTNQRTRQSLYDDDNI